MKSLKVYQQNDYCTVYQDLDATDDEYMLFLNLLREDRKDGKHVRFAFQIDNVVICQSWDFTGDIKNAIEISDAHCTDCYGYGVIESISFNTEHDSVPREDLHQCSHCNGTGYKTGNNEHTLTIQYRLKGLQSVGFLLYLRV